MIATPDNTRGQPLPDPIVVEAMAIYDKSIRARLEPAHSGEFVVINLDTGE